LPALQNNRSVVLSVPNAPTTQPSNQRAVASPNLFQQQETHNPVFSPVTFNNSTSNVGRSSSQKRNRPSVLRFGETVESLFQLDGMSSSEYWNVCRSITTTNTNDQAISLWRKILELASRHVATVEQPSSVQQLMRLYRRATCRLDCEASEDLFAIWLLYAKDLTGQGLEKDARFICPPLQACSHNSTDSPDLS
jgi:hypothetical protein